MFLIILFIIPSILGIIFYLIDKDKFEASCVIFATVALFFLVIIIMSYPTSYTDQIKAIESVEECNQNRVVYENQRNELMRKFEYHLTKQYPQHEKEIFDKLNHENISMFAAVFPQIKASETIMDYCNKIDGLTKNIYDQDLLMNKYKKDIRIRKRNHVGYALFLPDLPEEYRR